MARQEEILEEFAELSPQGKVVICGGEPLLDVNPYFRICSTARALKLRTLSVINGTLIVTIPHAIKMLTLGPDEISISLDGHTEAIHDRMRGRRGAFAQTTNALKMLVLARKRALKQNPHIRMPKIYAMGLLTKSVAPYLDEFYDLVLNQIGADKLKLNALQPSFLQTRTGQARENDDFFVAESQVDEVALEILLTKCNEKYSLGYNPHWMRQVVDYFRGLKGHPNLGLGWKGGMATNEHICDSPERNIMIDLVGRASLCFSTAFPNTQLNVRGDLKRYWESNSALKHKMSSCNRLCGISHSVRREHATLRVLP